MSVLIKIMYTLPIDVQEEPSPECLPLVVKNSSHGRMLSELLHRMLGKDRACRAHQLLHLMHAGTIFNTLAYIDLAIS